MAICEASLENYKQSGFPTHFGFCKYIKTLILKGGKINHLFMYIVIYKLDLIFGMDAETTGGYIRDFFSMDKFLIFEKVVIDTNRHYPINF